jgi:hypothetical protein
VLVLLVTRELGAADVAGLKAMVSRRRAAKLSGAGRGSGSDAHASIHTGSDAPVL